MESFYAIVFDLGSSPSQNDYSMESSKDIYRCSATHAKLRMGSVVGVERGPEDVFGAVIVDMDSDFEELLLRFNQSTKKFEERKLPSLCKLCYGSNPCIILEDPVMGLPEGENFAVGLDVWGQNDFFTNCSIFEQLAAPVVNTSDEEKEGEEGAEEESIDLTSEDEEESPYFLPQEIDDEDKENDEVVSCNKRKARIWETSFAMPARKKFRVV